MSAIQVKSKKFKTASGLRMQLVKEIHKNPCLYDDDEMRKAHPDKRKRCWELIATKLGAEEKDVKDLKAIWKNLQDSLRRCRVAAAKGSEPELEYWAAMKWLADFKDEPEAEPARKKPKKELMHESQAHNSATAEYNYEAGADVSNDAPVPPQRSLVEEIFVEEPPQQDPRVDQLIELLQQQLTVDNTPNVHMGHALGQRVDRLPLEMQDEAIRAMMATLSEFEEKARSATEPATVSTFEELTGNNDEHDRDTPLGERDLVIDENDEDVA